VSWREAVPTLQPPAYHLQPARKNSAGFLGFAQHTGIEERLYITEARPLAAVAVIGITIAAACCLAGKRHGPLFFLFFLSQ
jgi:hypothetical protein